MSLAGVLPNLGRKLGLGLNRQSDAPARYIPEHMRLEREREQARKHYRPTDQETDLVQIVDKRYRLAEMAKEPYYGVWALCLAFYKGDQYRKWEPITRQLLPVDAMQVPEWRERVIDNQITLLVQTAAAKWNRAKHVTRCLPNDPRDQEDVAAAETGTKALRHLDRVTHRNRKRRQLETQRAIYGMAFLSPYWDSQRKAEVALVDPQTGAIRGKEAYVGEADFELLNVWEVAPQPAESWDRVTWCVKAKWRTLEWLVEAYGDRGLLVTPETPGGELFGKRSTLDFRGIFNKVHGESEGDQNDREPGALLKEYYSQPSRHYPRGRYLVVANGVLLWQSDLPHPKQRFPVIPVMCQYVPDSLWARGVVEDQLGQQILLNKLEGRIQENINLTAWPKALSAKGSLVEHPDEPTWSNEPGEHIVWDSKGGQNPEPKYLTPPSMPGYAADMPELIKQRMQTSAGLNQASLGEMPSGVSSGIAIDLQQKADDTRMALAAEDSADAYKDLDQQLLEMVQAWYTVPRVIRVMGKSTDAGEALAFLGTDLRGNTEVALEASDGISDDISTKRQRYMDYYEAGLIPPNDLEALAELHVAMDETELAEIARNAQQRAVQAQQAAEEQQRLAMEQQAGAGQAQEQAAAQEQALKLQGQEAAMQQQAQMGDVKLQQEQQRLALEAERQRQALEAERDKHELGLAMQAARAQQMQGAGKGRAPAARGSR